MLRMECVCLCKGTDSRRSFIVFVCSYRCADCASESQLAQDARGDTELIDLMRTSFHVEFSGS